MKGSLVTQIEKLQRELKEANETIEAIRRGEIDALVIKGKHGNEVYTLESADHTYRVFLEKMSEGAVTLDERGRIQYSNSSFASMVSRTPGLVVAELLQDFVANKDRNYFTHLLEQGWKEDIKGEVFLISNDSYIPVQLSITPLRLGGDLTLSMLITDLTTQKEAQEQLKFKNDQLAASNLALGLSNNDLQHFASVASHDLQEPLRKILIFANTLKDQFAQELSDMPRLYIDKILTSASRMKVLIINILNYSILSQDNNNNFESTDLKVLISELLEDLEMTVGEKKAVIAVDVLPTLPVIRGQMRQVFQNLISNALKFTQKGINPHIDIRGTEDLDGFSGPEGFSGKFYHIHIKDNGIGFEEKYSKNIFNLFEKLNSRENYEGTGIGLAICKKIIEKHHGQITVKSKPGVGSDFIISLPVEQGGQGEHDLSHLNNGVEAQGSRVI